MDALLLDVYELINEPDGLYALVRSSELASLTRLWEHEGLWSRALVGHDIAARAAGLSSSTATPQPLLRCISGLGCSHLLQRAVDHDAKGHAGLEPQFEAAWRFGSWAEVPESLLAAPTEAVAPVSPAGAAGGPPGFHASLCTCLRALSSGNTPLVDRAVMQARAAEVLSISRLSMESVASVSPALVRLRMLQRAEGATQGLRVEGQSIVDRTWADMQRRAGAAGSYQLVEPLLAWEVALAAVQGPRTGLLDRLLDQSAMARKGNQVMQSAALVWRVKSLAAAAGPPVPERLQVRLRCEEAKVLWAQGLRSMAITVGRELVGDLQKHGGHLDALVRMMSLCGKWMLETRSQDAAAVTQDFLQPATAETGPEVSTPVRARAVFRLALFSDHLFRRIEEQQRSPEHQTQQLVLQQKQRDLDKLKAMLRTRSSSDESTDTRWLKYYINQIQKSLNLDREGLLRANEARAKYLAIALETYGQCLRLGSPYDLEVVFRMCQLWFSLTETAEVNDLVYTYFATEDACPSHKLLPLVYQMGSRISGLREGQDSPFQRTLEQVLLRLGRDHPFHTLPHLFALAHGNMDKRGKAIKTTKTLAGGMQQTLDLDKVEAVRAIIEILRNGHRRRIVTDMETVTLLYIELAAYGEAEIEASKKRKEPLQELPFPGSLRRRVPPEGLPGVPVLSSPVEVDPACVYDPTSFPYLVSFDPKIRFVGGVNHPKLIRVRNSYGRFARELVKSGSDDLRQDAVMQQIFATCNTLLAKNAETRRRRLRIATYRVVPFTPFAGLLEWVPNTMPLGEWLSGPTRCAGAHARYRRPGQLSYLDVYSKIDKAPEGELLQHFKEACDRFPPVLHHFFLECFREPAQWFERRLAYTRSSAVNSMVGYIIGLGDRHSYNILINRSSAEVVHIDLGIAFEQGRMLNTPELVPFRLTRDIVDGMGATGVEGAMRRCCEATLRVLREHRDALLTIVEVFLHDPLYKWALTPVAAQRRQNRQIGSDLGPGREEEEALENQLGTGLGNVDAERALLRIRQKLEGLDEADGEPLGVEGQVQMLFQRAMDPALLCRMFVGW